MVKSQHNSLFMALLIINPELKFNVREIKDLGEVGVYVWKLLLCRLYISLCHRGVNTVDMVSWVGSNISFINYVYGIRFDNICLKLRILYCMYRNNLTINIIVFEFSGYDILCEGPFNGRLNF